MRSRPSCRHSKAAGWRIPYNAMEASQMAKNRLESLLEDTTIAAVAEVAAINGMGFDAMLENIILTGLAHPLTDPAPALKKQPAAKPAKKPAAKSRK